MGLHAGQTQDGTGKLHFCSQRAEVPWRFSPTQPEHCSPSHQCQLFHWGGRSMVCTQREWKAAGHGSGLAEVELLRWLRQLFHLAGSAGLRTVLPSDVGDTTRVNVFIPMSPPLRASLGDPPLLLPSPCPSTSPAMSHLWSVQPCLAGLGWVSSPCAEGGQYRAQKITWQDWKQNH